MEDSGTIIKRPRLTNDNVEVNTNVVVSLPVELMVNVMTYLDVQDLVEIKPVSSQWQHLSTAAIEAKGIGTTRKAFETNQELKDAVKRYCPLPQGDMDDETTKQQYCDREDAEDIACKYGWPINKWDVSQIEDFTGVFDGSEEEYNEETGGDEYVNGIRFFDEDISDWDVSKARTMERMFKEATKFHQNLSSWNVFNVTNMSRMFNDAKMFNGDLSTWNVSNITDMQYMFSGCTQFNQDLSTWNVSNVTNMESMFFYSEHFNQNLSLWDVSNVTEMSAMFSYAKQFNQDLSTWDVSNVSFMMNMFDGATNLNQNLSSWGEDWVLDQLQLRKFLQTKKPKSDEYIDDDSSSISSSEI